MKGRRLLPALVSLCLCGCALCLNGCAAMQPERPKPTLTLLQKTGEEAEPAYLKSLTEELERDGYTLTPDSGECLVETSFNFTEHKPVGVKNPLTEGGLVGPIFASLIEGSKALYNATLPGATARTSTIVTCGASQQTVSVVESYNDHTYFTVCDEVGKETARRVAAYVRDKGGKAE